MSFAVQPKEKTVKSILEAALANIQNFVAASEKDLPNRSLIQKVVFEQIKDAIYSLKELEDAGVNVKTEGRYVSHS